MTFIELGDSELFMSISHLLRRPSLLDGRSKFGEETGTLGCVRCCLFQHFVNECLIGHRPPGRATADFRE